MRTDACLTLVRLSVKMISHEAIGVNLPARFLACLGECLERILGINDVHENVLAPVAPIHDPSIHHMVNGTGLLDPQLAWHAAEERAFPQFQPSAKSTNMSEAKLWFDGPWFFPTPSFAIVAALQGGREPAIPKNIELEFPR